MRNDFSNENEGQNGSGQTKTKTLTLAAELMKTAPVNLSSLKMGKELAVARKLTILKF